jgi:hypothetical protein
MEKGEGHARETRMENSDSLCAQVLKGHYFRDSDFMGSNKKEACQSYLVHDPGSKGVLKRGGDQKDWQWHLDKHLAG